MGILRFNTAPVCAAWEETAEHNSVVEFLKEWQLLPAHNGCLLLGATELELAHLTRSDLAGLLNDTLAPVRQAAIRLLGTERPRGWDAQIEPIVIPWRVWRVEVTRRYLGSDEKIIWETIRGRVVAEKRFQSWVHSAFGTADLWPHTLVVSVEDSRTPGLGRISPCGAAAHGMHFDRFDRAIRAFPRRTLSEWVDYLLRDFHTFDSLERFYLSSSFEPFERVQLMPDD